MVVFDQNAFEKKHKDKDGQFFITCHEIVKRTFSSGLIVLKESLDNNNPRRWFSAVINIKMIARDMFLEDLKNVLPEQIWASKMKNPNQEDYDILKNEITKVLELILNKNLVSL